MRNSSWQRDGSAKTWKTNTYHHLPCFPVGHSRQSGSWLSVPPLPRFSSLCHGCWSAGKKPEKKKYMDGHTRKRNLWFDILISSSMWLHHPTWGAQLLNFPQISETGGCIHLHCHPSAQKQIYSSAWHGSDYPALRVGTFRPHHFHLIAWQCC